MNCYSCDSVPEFAYLIQRNGFLLKYNGPNFFQEISLKGNSHNFVVEGIESRSWHILARITLPVFAAVLMITEMAKQILRGISFLVTSLVSLDGFRFIAGCRDLITAPLNILAMTVLGITSFFSPKNALQFTASFMAKLSTTSVLLKSAQPYYLISRKTAHISVISYPHVQVTSLLSEVLERVFLMFQQIVRGLKHMAVSALLGSVPNAVTGGALVITALPISMIVTDSFPTLEEVRAREGYSCPLYKPAHWEMTLQQGIAAAKRA